MAIIYTYPVKATAASGNDLIIISDSEDKSKTKQIKVSSLPGGTTSGVDKVLAGTGGVTIDSSNGNGTGTVTVNIPDSSVTALGSANFIPKFDSGLNLVDSVLKEIDSGVEERVLNYPTPGQSSNKITLGSGVVPGGSIVVGSTVVGVDNNSASVSTTITDIDNTTTPNTPIYTLASAFELGNSGLVFSSNNAFVQKLSSNVLSATPGTYTGTVGVTTGLSTSGSGTGAALTVTINSSGNVSQSKLINATFINGYALGDTITATSSFITGATPDFIITLSKTSFIEQLGGSPLPADVSLGLYYPTFRLANTTQANPNIGKEWEIGEVLGSFEFYNNDGSDPGKGPTSYVRSLSTVKNGFKPIGGISFGVNRWDTSVPRYEQGNSVEVMTLNSYYNSVPPFIYPGIGAVLGNRLTIKSGRSDTSGTEVKQQAALRFLNESQGATWDTTDTVISTVDTFTEDTSTPGGPRVLTYINTVVNSGSVVPNGELIFGTALGGASGAAATTKMRLHDTGKLQLLGDLELDADLLDISNGMGAAGTVLKSNGVGNGVSWVTASSVVSGVVKVDSTVGGGLLTSPATGIINTGSVGVNYGSSAVNIIKSASPKNAPEPAIDITTDEVLLNFAADNTVRRVLLSDLGFSTNTSSLTFSGGISKSGTDVSLDTPVTAVNGGTGLTSISTLLNSNVNYTSDGSGTLPVLRGGTGITSATNKGILFGNGSSPVGVTSVGTAGHVLTSNGAGVSPTFQVVSGGGGGSGTVTSVSAGTGLSTTAGGAITTTGTINLDQATSTLRGGIELFSDVDQETTAVVHSLAGQANSVFGLQLNAANQGVVNVTRQDLLAGNGTYTFTTIPGEGGTAVTLIITLSFGVITSIEGTGVVKT